MNTNWRKHVSRVLLAAGIIVPLITFVTMVLHIMEPNTICFLSVASVALWAATIAAWPRRKLGWS